MRASSSSGTPSPRNSASTPVPRLGLATSPTYGTPSSSAAAEDVQLVPAVRRHHEREIAGSRLDLGAVDGQRVELELGADADDRARDRRVADDEDARRGQDRLEEHLDRTS